MERNAELYIRVKIVLQIMEETYQENQRKGVLELIYKRYSKALQLLEINEKDKNQFNILGGVRAYLSSYSDYENPLLNEMDKAETLFELIYNPIIGNQRKG
jgi:hypothetical protein